MPPTPTNNKDKKAAFIQFLGEWYLSQIIAEAEGGKALEPIKNPKAKAQELKAETA